jgi:Sec-independent protein translocase protein TatA
MTPASEYRVDLYIWRLRTPAGRVAGVERSEPQWSHISGGSLRSSPATHSLATKSCNALRAEACGANRAFIQHSQWPHGAEMKATHLRKGGAIMKFASTAMVLVLGLLLTGCEKKPDAADAMRKAADKMNEAADKMDQASKEAQEKARQAGAELQKAGQEMKEKAQAATNEARQDAGDALQKAGEALKGSPTPPPSTLPASAPPSSPPR